MREKDSEIQINHLLLRDFLINLFRLSECADFTSEAVVNGLMYASLRGIDSHGVRLVPHYIASALAGRKNPNPEFKVYRDGAVLRIDADHGFGLASGAFALEEAVKVAQKLGVCFATVYNSTHPAAISATTSLAVESGCAAIGFANADSLMRTTNSSSSFFGTNPISFAAPSANGRTFCVDLATTTFTWNKVKMYRDAGEELPIGVAADEFGVTTTDPYAARMLLPMGEHKGYALAAMVEVLTSCINGTPSATEIDSMYEAPIGAKRKLSQTYIVFTSAIFGESNVYNRKMATLERLLQTESITISDQEVMLPGRLEEIAEEERRLSGIPLDVSLIRALNRLMRERGGSPQLGL